MPENQTGTPASEKVRKNRCTTQVANHPREWIQRVKGTESRYYRAIGSAEALMLKAADLGQRWMKGVSREFALKKLREQPLPW